MMQDGVYHRSRNSVLTITGNDVVLRVKFHGLEVLDGFKAEGETRRRYVHRAVAQPDRVLLLATSGFATLSALDWCGENGIPVVCCDQAGHLRWTLLPGDGGQWRANLRRAQALAPFSSVGMEIARWLLVTKATRQAALLDELVPRAQEQASNRVANPLRTILSQFHDPAATIERLRFLESQAAEAYWSGWTGLQVQFAPPSYARAVSAHWRSFTSRHSPLSGGAKNAVDPVNALLNLGYSLLAAETLIACHGAGLDPALGILHADRDARLSFLYDLMEPVRPAADRRVLDLVLTHAFRRGELWDLRDGTCRLDQELAARLCGEWMPHFRREVTPVVEKVASWLRRARITPQEHPAHKPLPKVVTDVPRGICPECGSLVRPGRRFCSAACYQVWWKTHVMQRVTRQGNDVQARLRAEGRDPAHGGEAGRKRAATMSRVKRREWMSVPSEERRRRTRPATLARWRREGLHR